MESPFAIRLVAQENRGDCVIAALATYLGVPYGEIATRVTPKQLTTGMSWREAQEAAAMMGVNLVMRRSYNLDEDSGIIAINRCKRGTKPKAEHAAVLLAGHLYDPEENLLWLDIDAYLRDKGGRWRFGSLLTRED